MKSKQKLLDKYVLYLETLSSSTINSLDHYVAENVRFKDPFNVVVGLKAKGKAKTDTSGFVMN